VDELAAAVLAHRPGPAGAAPREAEALQP
jgi:hypothetical protein